MEREVVFWFKQFKVIAELFPDHLLVFILVVCQLEEQLYVFEADLGLHFGKAKQKYAE